MILKIKLALIIFFCGIGFYGLCQCPSSHTDVCSYESKFIFFQSPSTCFPSGTCSGLEKGYLIISVEDSIVLDGVDGSQVNFNNYEGCVAVVPICYDLSAIQNFVDLMLNSMTCCSTMNAQSNGLCDSVMAKYNSGSEIMGLNDLISVFGSDTVKATSIQEALDLFNSQILLIQFACFGAQVIQYCVDPVDFEDADIVYEINPFCPYPDCMLDTIDIAAAYLANDPHQSVFKSNHTIKIEGDITSTEMIELRAENEVILHPGFSTLGNATLEIVTEPCVSPPPPPINGPNQRR